MPKLKRGDRALIIIGAVCLAAAALWLAAGALGLVPAAATDGLTVVCQTREGFRREDPLDGDARYTVETSEGYNAVVISNGQVEVAEADCSNQVCVEHDPIDQVGEQIVCLPHGMVIEVVENPADATVLN